MSEKSVGDLLEGIIQNAIEKAVRKALNISDATNRRLLSVEEAAVFLSLSKRELYNMIANHELPAVKHGRRTLLDTQDLIGWIERNKSA